MNIPEGRPFVRADESPEESDISGERSRLFFKAFDAQITFVIDGNGRAKELILHEAGTDVHANRIK
jgi:hypothetical protein